MLSIGLSSSRPDLRQLLTTSHLSDISRRVERIIFPPIIRGKVDFKDVVIAGKMGCGKTTLFNYYAHRAIENYGRSRVNMIAARSIPQAIEALDDKPVQLIFIDDAIRNANSRKPGSQAEEAGDYYEIRHIYEDKNNRDTGVIIVFYATQRYKMLDLIYRDASVIIFKSWPMDRGEQRTVTDYISDSGQKRLKEITEAVTIRHNDEIKSESIAYIGVTETTGRIITGQTEKILNFNREDILTYEPGEPFTFTREIALEKLRRQQGGKWKVKARYYAALINGQTQEQIAEKFKISQPAVSAAIKSIRGEISRMGGAEYELWKYTQLKDSYPDDEVIHDGGIGKPDLVVIAADGRRFIYSLKCIDFERSITIPKRELEPEIREALAHRTNVILSVFNLHDRKEQELTLSPSTIGDSVKVSP